MMPVSVVIITKNEAEIIGDTISKARLITNDIVIIDSGSTDATLQIVRDAGCRVYQKRWDGYAANKNKGIKLATHDWILSIDADEAPDEQLILSIHKLKLNNPQMAYDIKFKSYFGQQQIRFGKWGRDHHIRLFNRKLIKWYESPVHETLAIPFGIKTQRLKGNLNHYSVKNMADFKSKLVKYSMLCSEKYYLNGVKSTFIKRQLSPVFSFIKNYIFFLGFLDGKAGWQIAILTVKHTKLKYELLQKMRVKNMNEVVYRNDKLAVEY